jgi:hypothetical protein
VTYLEMVNNPNFRRASLLVDQARKLMKEIMTQDEAFDWIKAWASGAGDGIGDDDEEE